MSDEAKQLEEAFRDGRKCAAKLLRVAIDNNMTPRGLSIASMILLSMASKGDDVPYESVLEVLRSVWDSVEFVPGDLH